MTRRSGWRLAAVAAALLLVAGSVHWASRPQRLTGVLMGRIGDALGLEITAGGASEYTLRGDPRLVVRDLVARQPGAPEPILRAARIELSLPWSTLRARGAVLEATRLELEAPRLDLRALQRWQATRPPAEPPRIPTLTRGLAIRSGQVVGDGWQVEALDLDLPALHPGRPVRAALGGRVVAGAMRMPFDLALALSAPSPDATAEARGSVGIRMRDWSMPMRVQAAGRLRLGDGSPRIEAFRLGARARHVAAGVQRPFVLGLAGVLRLADGVALRPAGLALRGADAIPTLDAGGRIAWGDALALGLDGALARWPQAWPALPEPIGRPRTPLPFVLAYRGPADLSGPASLRLRHGANAVDARFRLPDVLAWLDASATGSPLPPIEGHVVAPRLVVAGATLEGVEVGFEDDGASPGPPAPRLSPGPP